METILEKNLLSCHEFSENLKRWYNNNTLPMAETEYPFNPKLEEEKNEAIEDDSNENPPPDIVAYNELRSCADLVRLAEAQLEIAPDFQRGFVWGTPEQTRFIDSLIKGLPIPSLCFSYDFKANKRLVIDGRQRIQTIINFLTDKDYKLSSLDDIDENISGKSIFEIKKDHKVYYDRVENLAIPVTIIRCSYDNPAHMQYLFKIFHRLNSGGVRLTNQEIRNCIYTGLFNKYLKDTVEYPEYVKLMDIEEVGKKEDGKPKYKYYKYAFEELNLRFFALYDLKNLDDYTGKLTTFLNTYMMSKKLKEDTEGKDAIKKEIEDKDKLFKETLKMIQENIHTIPIHELSKAITEALFVGVCSNLDYLKSIDSSKIQSEMERMFEKLRNDDKIKATLQGGIAKKQNMTNRIRRAKAIFSGQQ